MTPPHAAASLDVDLERILAALLGIMRGQFDCDLPVEDPDSPVDAIHLALNMTAEELSRLEEERQETLRRLDHLNRVLRAIRSVNQLIVTEKRPAELIRQACELLVESRGYRRAWLATAANDDAVPKLAQAGWGEVFRSLEELFAAGGAPPCVQTAREAGGVVVVAEPHTECEGCPLREHHATERAMVAPLTHDGRAFGVVVVSVPEEVHTDAEEQALLHEVALDLGYALHSIEVDEQRAQAIEEQRRTHRQLKDMTAQLVHTAKLTAMGELAASVAHELNQPLNGIQLIAQSLLRYREDRTEHLEEDLQDIIGLVGGMSQIIDHMRVFSRSSVGSTQAPVDVNQVAKRSLRLVTAQLAHHDIELRQELSSDLPQVLGDAVQLEQVMLNLVTNARDGLDQAVRDDKRLVLRTTARPAAGPGQAARVVVELADNGIGIPAERLTRIFEPFFTTKDAGQGTGLGLSVARKIIEEHGGAIEIESQVDEGTVARIVLPAMSEGQRAERGRPRSDRPA